MQDPLSDGGQLASLAPGDGVEDKPAHLVDVAGCGGDDLVPAVVGQDG